MKLYLPVRSTDCAKAPDAANAATRPIVKDSILMKITPLLHVVEFTPNRGRRPIGLQQGKEATLSKDRHGRACALPRRELPIEIVQHLVARQHLGDARIRLAAFADGGEKLGVLQLDAVHRYVDLGDVDLFFLAVHEIVVARDIGAGVADIAEEGA